MIRTEWVAEPPVELPEEVARTTETVRYAYPDTKTLVALRGNAVAAAWVLPISTDETGAHARRVARVLPYAAPVLRDRHPQRRRDVMVALLDAVRNDCVSLDLPMAPDFRDVTACRQLGMAVEWRHTHMLDLDASWRVGYSATVRQHLRTAQAAVKVRTSEVSQFRFDLALVGSDRHGSRDAEPSRLPTAGPGRQRCSDGGLLHERLRWRDRAISTCVLASRRRRAHRNTHERDHRRYKTVISRIGT